MDIPNPYNPSIGSECIMVGQKYDTSDHARIEIHYPGKIE